MQQISPGSCAFEIRRSLQFKWYEPLTQTIMGIDLRLTFQTMNNYLLSLLIDHVISLCPVIMSQYLIIANGNWVCWHFFIGAYEYRSVYTNVLFSIYFITEVNLQKEKVISRVKVHLSLHWQQRLKSFWNWSPSTLLSIYSLLVKSQICVLLCGVYWPGSFCTQL